MCSWYLHVEMHQYCNFGTCHYHKTRLMTQYVTTAVTTTNLWGCYSYSTNIYLFIYFHVLGKVKYCFKNTRQYEFKFNERAKTKMLIFSNQHVWLQVRLTGYNSILSNCILFQWFKSSISKIQILPRAIGGRGTLDLQKARLSNACEEAAVVSAIQIYSTIIVACKYFIRGCFQSS